MLYYRTRTPLVLWCTDMLRTRPMHPALETLHSCESRSTPLFASLPVDPSSCVNRAHGSCEGGGEYWSHRKAFHPLKSSRSVFFFLVQPYLLFVCCLLFTVPCHLSHDGAGTAQDGRRACAQHRKAAYGPYGAPCSGASRHGQWPWTKPRTPQHPPGSCAPSAPAPPWLHCPLGSCSAWPSSCASSSSRVGRSW